MSLRTVLITGCSSGIGLDAARALAARGWRVFATCRREADCARLRAEGLESFRLDYEDPASIAEAASEAEARGSGAVDALFNNGAYAIPGFVEDLPPDALRAIFEANLIGWHDLTRRLLPGMRARGAGRIVQCSSVLGFAAVRWRGAYVATKFALEGLTDTLRLELRGSGVRVSLIEPGPIETRFNENALTQYARWIDPSTSAHKAELAAVEARYRGAGGARNPFTLPPEAVTRRVIHALESPRPRARYRVTTPTHVVALLRRIAPQGALDWLMARQ
ncbi:MAG: SDR family NAD(P)-dependent oxidoreductase [Rhodobacteraceae bacterium]|nr:MAG: SDR family NAD(P)-dependent oxidoreductase [Paracoccaceae bacterium]